MRFSILIHALFLGVSLFASGCKNYSTVIEKQPYYAADSPAGQVIHQALEHPAEQPEVQIGRFLDAASTASRQLAADSASVQARLDYSFAIGRIFEVVNASKLELWRAPIQCPGADGPWSFSLNPKGLPVRGPALEFFSLRPADRYTFKGTLVKDRSLKDGLGAPMVAVSEGLDLTQVDRFAQGEHTYYGLTAVIDFTQRSCSARLLDPLSVETVDFEGHTYPLAADFTAPLALALAELNPRQEEIERLVRPEDFASSARLARLQTYDPDKIPILCIHGLGDSHATWAPLIETLRGDAVIRKNYQFWFFSYPTGFPYPLMASVLRKEMDAINRKYPDHKPIVVLGHSMGGMIARTLMTDSGMKLWNAYYDKPPGKTALSPETRKIMSDALIFRHRKDISRVIFASASLRGSELATSFLGRMGSALIGSAPAAPGNRSEEAITEARPPAFGDQVKRMPNSIDILDPDNRFLLTINAIPVVKGIPYHSIMGDRGKGGNLDRTEPVSTDGLVPYWSSHIDGAESELIVPSGHWSNQNPQAIAEVGRILHRHLKTR